ncbi:MAG: hypothetical protein K2X35_24065 [Bryobacteraceae bacterium]|nr:hypothetical protein [Bryobacteraceae bacterium]
MSTWWWALTHSRSTASRGLTGDLDLWIRPDRVPGLLGEIQVNYLSRASLLKNKRSTGRAKDLGDVELLGETIG